MSLRTLARGAAVAGVVALSAALLPVPSAAAAAVDRIVAPTSGATLSGTVTIQVSAAEDPACGSGYDVTVDFSLDGNGFEQAIYPAPDGYYEVGWDTTLASKGAHTLQATVTDSCNNQVFLSEPVTIDNGNPPTVTMTAPIAGNTVSGAVTLSAGVTQGTSATISQVDFYDGTTLVDTAYYSPYNASWDTTQVADGTHSLHATAYDSNNQVGTSSPIEVAVTNPHPSVAITAPTASSSVLHNTVQISATASDQTDQINYVRLFVDGNALVTLTAAPYTYAWDTTFEGDGQHTLTADAYTTTGKRGTSPGVVVTTDNTDPIAALVSPAGGGTVSGTNAMLTASSNAPQSCPSPTPWVQFVIDGGSGATVQTPAQDGTYTTALDTTALTNGPHQLQVHATCDGGYSWGPLSTAVSVTVFNPVPVISFTSPTADQQVSGNSLDIAVGATPTDGATISQVEFSLDSTLLATDMTAPYGITFDTTKQSLGAHTLRVRALDSNNRVAETSETLYVVSPTTVSLTVPTRTLTYPTAETVSATLRASQPAPGGVLSGRSLSLLRRTHGTSTWTVAAGGTTNVSGVASFRIAPDRNTDYAVRYLGVTNAYRGSTSSLATVSVRPRVSLAAASTSVALGRYVTLSTTLGPNLAGRPVYLQRWTGTSWVSVGGRTLDRYSHATWSFRPGARGYTTYRVYRAADSTHLSGVSSKITVRVS